MIEKIGVARLTFPNKYRVVFQLFAMIFKKLDEVIDVVNQLQAEKELKCKK